MLPNSLKCKVGHNKQTKILIASLPLAENGCVPHSKMEINDWPQLVKIKRYESSAKKPHAPQHFSSVLFLQCSLLSLCVAMAVIVGCDAWDVENNYNIRVNDHGFELTQSNNLQRQEMIQRHCENIPPVGDTTRTLANTPDDQLDHLLIDPKHKFLYCYVPKVACTNWKRILMLMTDQWANGTDPLKIPASMAHSPGM